MRTQRILVVDDERAFAEILFEMLREEGYSVERAYDGRQALALVAANGPPDLVLCDVMLPKLNGAALTSELRRRFPTLPLPVVLMSASADPRLREPNVHFLAKPLDFLELLGLIEMLLGDASRTLAAETQLRSRRATNPASASATLHTS